MSANIFVPKTGVLVPKRMATPGLTAKTPRPVHATDTDDFVGPDQIQAQIDMFKSYEGVIPRPAGWNLLVLMVSMPEESTGGVLIDEAYRNQKSMASPQGIILALGHTAYNEQDDRFPNGPWCTIGDRVLFGRYSGKTFRIANGQNLAFLVDTDIIGVVESGWLER